MQKQQRILCQAYKQEGIYERYRHRFHIQKKFITDEAKEKVLRISSRDETGTIINSIELNREGH